MRLTCIPISALVALVALVAGCQLRKPFEATVVAAGASGKDIKHGFFAREQVLESPDGDVEYFLDVDVAALGKPTYGAAAASVEIEPLAIDDEEGAGYVVFDLMSDGDRPDTQTDLLLLSWVDGDDDDKLDLSQVGDSEAARTIWRHDEDSNEKAVLNSYNYLPNADDPYYTAVALTPSIVNVIVTEDTLRDWMAVLPADKDAAPPPPDSDGDGLHDFDEQRLGTSTFDSDTDFDGEDDLTEVGDVLAPRDSDGDGVIDAKESSIGDLDGDGTPDESDAT